MGEPWLSKDAQRVRRFELGLNDDKASKFLERCEFISLGSYCGVSRALQALGLKKFSYPFDWLRSPIEGVAHLMDSDFADFLTFSIMEDKGQVGKLYGSTRWGGSFWHHDPEQPKTRDDFVRRIERLYGLQEVPPNKPRVFVRAVNSTRELDSTLVLYEALCRALPRAEVFLLMLIDFQSETGPLKITGAGSVGDHVLFYRIHESLFAENGRNWTMQQESEAYAEGIAFASGVWAGRATTIDRKSVV